MTKLKNIRWSVMVAALMVVVLMVSSYAGTAAALATGAHISAAAAQTTLGVGDKLTVTVKRQAVNAYTYTGGISYNKNELEVAKIEKASGADLDAVSTVSEAKNSGTIGFYKIGTDAKKYGEAVLVTVTFKAKKAGVTTIDVYENTHLANDSVYDNGGKSVQTIKVTITKALLMHTLKAANAKNGVKVAWNKDANADGYILYRKTGTGKYVTVKKLTSNATLSYVDKTAKSGTKYTYALRSYRGSTKGPLATKVITHLASVTPTLKNTAKGVTVKWAKVAGAKGYYVYRKTGTAKYSLVKKITSGSKVSYIDTAVKAKNGTKYTYVVKAYNGATVGAYTAKTIVRLTAPAISSAANTASKTMTVSWKKNAKATGYQIRYAANSKFTSAKTITVKNAATVSKTIKNLTKDKTYYVQVRAYKTVSKVNYYSAWSAAKAVKIEK